MADFHIAIIGAGLSGLALALALHKRSIACIIYEARDAPLNTGGGLMLTPNGLKVLNAIGIYDTLVDESWAFDKIYIQHGPSGKLLETVEYGSMARYGMRALRSYRSTVLEQLLTKVRQQNIPIHFNKRFSHVLSETDREVTWQFVDGSTSTASLLVGADGIRSTVRAYVAPGVKPTYNGIITLVAAVPTVQVGFPAKDLENLNDETNKYPQPGGIVVPGVGAIIAAPQNKTGDELMLAVMRPFPDEPEHWTPLINDKDRLRAMFRENAEKFPDIVQNAVADIPDAELSVWPAYTIPRLESWTSANSSCGGQGRVVVLGDAAHAVPPSSGQGVNQAFEDIYLFAGVLNKLRGDLGSHRLQAALRGWQSYRQDRVDGVLRLNKQMELRRLPPAAREQQGVTVSQETLQTSMDEEFDRLFRIDYDEAVNACWEAGSGV